MAQLGIDETMRILLVGEEQAICDELDAALGDQVDRYKIEWIAQPELSPVRAKDILPHLILLDDALGDSDIASLIQELASEVPDAILLALIAGGEVERAKQAVLAGARGFINKPLASDDLIATLSSAKTIPPGASSPIAAPKVAPAVRLCWSTVPSPCANSLASRSR